MKQLPTITLQTPPTALDLDRTARDFFPANIDMFDMMADACPGCSGHCMRVGDWVCYGVCGHCIAKEHASC